MKALLLILLLIQPYLANKSCSSRGGCVCDCSWTTKYPCSNAKDDGSCCFSCCCAEQSTPDAGACDKLWAYYLAEWNKKCGGGGSTPVNPTPVNPHPSTHKLYCPSKNDLTLAYGQSNIFDRGWETRGGGGVATKSAFNLLEGYVEYDVDVSRTLIGVNANIYTLSPTITSSSGFKQNDYCDGARNDHTWCVEIDWLESNGNCGGATTIHTIKGPGQGCTAWGCRDHYKYNGKTKFSMRVEYDKNGIMKTFIDGKSIGPILPPPRQEDWRILADIYKKKGGVIYSSQWVGWVPMENECGRSANDDVLSRSIYKISNLKIYGALVQGPVPTLCS